ncbi:MAG: hypothetical protein R3A10_16980 [Caldilineaceae bacterium]
MQPVADRGDGPLLQRWMWRWPPWRPTCPNSLGRSGSTTWPQEMATRYLINQYELTGELMEPEAEASP